MRWRLLAAFLGVMVVMLAAQDLPLVSHLRRVEVDRQLAELERDAFLLAGQAASALSPPDGGGVTAESDAEVALADTVTEYAYRHDAGVVVTDDDGAVVAAAGAPGVSVGDDLGDATRGGHGVADGAGDGSGG